MKYLICFFIATICHTTFAQDPTVPSGKILERLGRDQSISIVAPTNSLIQEQSKPPVLKLKAIVMTDSDHGIALIDVDGRRLRLRLERSTSTEQAVAPEHLSRPNLDSVVIQGSTYHVQSFSARSILLTSANQSLLVQ